MRNKLPALLLALALLPGLAACSAPTPGAPSTSIPPASTTSQTQEQSAPPSPPAEEEAPTAAAYVEGLAIGWNLGNTLDARGSGLESETAWGNPRATPELLQAVADKGFDVVRVPVTWQGHLGEGPGYAIDEAWLDRVNEVVDYVLAAGMACILNAHHEDWLYPDEAHKAQNLEQLTALWTQIAARFEGYGQGLIFEGLNEPRLAGTADEWGGGTPESCAVVNALNAAFIETVRGAAGENATRLLMVPAYVASHSREALASLELPEEDERLIVSVHAYLPYEFALNPGGTAAWSAENDADTGPLQELFATLDELFLQKGRPVIIGEAAALDKDNTAARAAWAEYYFILARMHGVPVLVWDNGILEGEGDRFGLLDRQTLKWAYPELVSAMQRAAEGVRITIESQ